MKFKLDLVDCRTCFGKTNTKYARTHEGRCKRCVEGKDVTNNKVASSEEQHARYIDSGWNDDRGESYD